MCVCVFVCVGSVGMRVFVWVLWVFRISLFCEAQPLDACCFIFVYLHNLMHVVECYRPVSVLCSLCSFCRLFDFYIPS